MSEVNLTNIAASSIATPVTDVAAVFADAADLRIKSKDKNGVVSILNNDGLQDFNNLYNSGLAIQQRVAIASTAVPGASATTRAGQVADRWAVTTGNTTTILWQQVNAGTTVETGLLTKFYGRITQNTNAAKFIFSQVLNNEDTSPLRGQKVRLSVKLKQFAGSNAVYRLGLLNLSASGVADTIPAITSAMNGASADPTWGTNLLAITPDAAPTGENGTISGAALNITSTAAWVRSSAVFTVPSNCLNLIFVLYRDTIGAASDSVGIAELQMTIGAEIVDWVGLSWAQELVRCQRYYSKSFPQTVVPAASIAVATGGTGSAGIIGKAGATALAVHINIQFPQTMWKTPVVTLFTPVNAGAVPMRIDGTTPAVQTAVAQLGLTDRGLTVTATGDAAGAVGDLVGVHYVAESEFIT